MKQRERRRGGEKRSERVGVVHAKTCTQKSARENYDGNAIFFPLAAVFPENKAGGRN